jgi:hypothetical protein
MILSQLLSRNEILEAIWQTVPIGAPAPAEVATLDRLKELTRALIARSHPRSLTIDPFTEVYKRQIKIDRSHIESILKNKVVLITGGRGFVGTNLIAKLQQFGVKQIVAVDISSDDSEQIAIDTSCRNLAIPVNYYRADVRDPIVERSATESLQQIFEIEKPQIVFHLAAERLPGLAEIKIHHTVSTNILGCENIINLCERYGVESCIFSSTGKSSRYFTPDIYAASKKIGEWLFSDNAHTRNCQYGIVRFTHVVENSPVSADLDRCIANGIIDMHAPDRYIYTQNIHESINLLLNALTIVKQGQTKLLAVRDIGWPINTTDLALHKIIQADRDIPIYFKGLPAGYERHVFLGQLDLSGDREMLPMLNVLEADCSVISHHGDMVISEIIPFDSSALAATISNIKAAIANVDVEMSPAVAIAQNATIKQTVIDGLKNIALSSFLRADSFRLIDILSWGINTEEMTAGGVDLSYYQETIELLVKGAKVPRHKRVWPIPAVSPTGRELPPTSADRQSKPPSVGNSKATLQSAQYRAKDKKDLAATISSDLS